MSIVSILRTWGNQPDILCDVCGEPIRYPDDPGFVVWGMPDLDGFEEMTDKPQEYLIVHQARCDPGRPGNRQGYEMSQALDEFIACALHNAGLNQTRLRRAMRRVRTLREYGL